MSIVAPRTSNKSYLKFVGANHLPKHMKLFAHLFAKHIIMCQHTKLAAVKKSRQTAVMCTKLNYEPATSTHSHRMIPQSHNRQIIE